MAVAPAAALLAVIAAAGCREADSPESVQSADIEAPETPLRFVDIAAESGLVFRHTNGATPHKYFPETMGGGGMFWDFDDDGLLDIYLVNSGWVVDEDREEPVYNALYHNTGAGRLAETAARAGVDDAGYGMGCAAGDYDNDGDPDLFVTNYGPNSFFRNDRSQPSGGLVSFIEVSQALDVADGRWGTGSAFADYDRDGDLDLYVANYVEYEPKRDAGARSRTFRPRISPITRETSPPTPIRGPSAAAPTSCTATKEAPDSGR